MLFVGVEPKAEPPKAAGFNPNAPEEVEPVLLLAKGLFVLGVLLPKTLPPEVAEVAEVKTLLPIFCFTKFNNSDLGVLVTLFTKPIIFCPSDSN